ncbi:hypothetical protein B0H34DRAFT_720644 [Crassisporium funariophilum]|nr:hypothetical protein B0H34DRAFT_720644 [Crassisporium funariophilum]
MTLAMRLNKCLLTSCALNLLCSNNGNVANLETGKQPPLDGPSLRPPPVVKIVSSGIRLTYSNVISIDNWVHLASFPRRIFMAYKPNVACNTFCLIILTLTIN